MGKPKRSRDTNVRAFEVVRELTRDPDEGKKPSQVESGRRGGKKGGPARKKALTPEQRSAIARRAAQARWGKSQES